MRKVGESAVLTLRVPKSGPAAEDPVREARRQSLLVNGRASERDTLRFIERSADTRGWR
jgi:hypothetical protein